MKKNRITAINTGFLVISAALVLLSLWKTIIQSDFIPYLPLLAGSVLSCLMFMSLIIAGGKNRYAALWTFVAVAGSCLMLLFYIYPSLLKELYPLQLWLTITVLVSSIQSALDRTRKRFHLQMRIFNYGLIVLLIPVIFLKTGTPWIWTVVSVVTLIVMLLNFVSFILPTRTGHSR